VYEPGWGTPYGQQMLSYLEVGASTGGFDPPAIQQAVYEAWRRPDSNAARRGYYYDRSTKEFLTNVAAGKKCVT
jgi:hypothetical protein